jgi:predicted ArsR family transcriptional regulator
MVSQSFGEDVERLATLEDPVRRRIYLFVRGEHRPVTREEVAEGASVSRKLAAFHLDKLVDRGLLLAAYRRPTGGGGPGSGRPPKLYEPSGVALTVSVPERRHDLLASLLARAVEGTGARTRQAVLDQARQDGRRMARAGRRRGRGAARAALAEVGFEPFVDSDGVIVFGNCPFATAARESPALVCALNHAFNEGVLDGLGRDDLEAVLAPAPGRCCVVVRPRT